MSDFTRDRDIVNYELPLLRTGADLEEALADPETRWYALRRLRSLNRLGLVAAGKWNPLLHPRGPDGKFITKFGWVRAIIDGRWTKGFVENIDAAGNISVRFGDDAKPKVYTAYEASKSLYAVPKPKARLDLPALNKTPDAKTWVTTGGQGGSNPGGKFKFVGDDPSAGHVSSDVVVKVLGGDISASSMKFPGPEVKIAVDPSGDPIDFLPPIGIAAISEGDGKYIVVSIEEQNIRNVITGETVNITTPLPKGSLIFEPDAGGNDALALEAVDARAAAIADIAEARLTVDDEIYVKRAKSVNHARNEVLANRFYELAGVPVPEVFYGEDPQYLGSKILKPQAGGTIQSLTTAFDDPELMSQIRSNFVVDAWLANWDVSGLTYDNIVIVDGVPTRIDAGGSLLYRAQGGPKGKNFGGQVGELKTLRDKKMNPQSAKVFGAATDEELRAGAMKVAAIHPDTIRDFVRSANLEDDLANVLIARRAYIIDEILNGEDPYTPKPKVATGYESSSDEQLIANAKTMAANGVIAPKLTAEMKFRGLDDELKKIEDDVEAMHQQGVDPRYPTVVPTDANDTFERPERLTPEEAVRLLLDDTPNPSEKGGLAEWHWDSANGVWYRGSPEFPTGDGFLGDVTEAVADQVADLVGQMAPFNGEPNKAEPTGIDTLFDGDGKVIPDKEGAWFWLGGQMWEIVGQGTPRGRNKSYPTVRLSNIASGREVDLPRSDYYSADFEDSGWTGSGWKTAKGTEAGMPMTIGYIVEPGELAEPARALLEQLWQAQMDDIARTYANGDLVYFGHADDRFTTELEYGGHTTAYTSTRAFGFNWATSPLGVYDWMGSPEKLRIGSPVADAMRRVSAEDVVGSPPGTFISVTTKDDDLRYGFVGVITSDKKVRVLRKNQYGNAQKYFNFSVPELKDKYSVGIGDEIPLSALWTGAIASDTLSYYVATPNTHEVLSARHSREQIITTARDALRAALDAEIENEDAAFLLPDKIDTLDPDAPVPASVTAYAKFVTAADTPVIHPKAVNRFTPSNSPLQFLGVVTGTQLIDLGDSVEGMWVIGNPKSRNGGMPLRITKVNVRTVEMPEGDEDVELAVVESIVGTDIMGNKHTIGAGYHSPLDAYAGFGDPREGPQHTNTLRLLRIAPPATAVSQVQMKKSGEVAIDGLIVGNWVTDHKDYEARRLITINGEFTASGEEMSFREKASKAKAAITPFIIIPPEHAAKVKAKSAKAKATKKAVVWKVGSLSDGTKVEAGIQVRSNITQKDGVLVGAIHPSRPDMVYVKFDEDGRIEVLEAANLTCVGKAKSPKKKAPAGKPKKLPTTDSLPAKVIAAMEKTPENFVLEDGGTPKVGMQVEVSGKKPLVGHVTGLYANGFMAIKDADGKVSYRQIVKGRSLEDASYDAAPEVGMTEATLKPPGSETMPDIGTSSPAAPRADIAGVTFLQSAEHREKWQEKGGLLTFDGFVPDIGLPVIDRQGNQLIIARHVSSSKEYVAVYDPSTPGKLKSRKVDGLTVDIASYAGEIGPIASLSLAFDGTIIDVPAGVPSGSSIYRVSETTYSGRGASYLYIVTPHGQAYRSETTYGWGTNASKPQWKHVYEGAHGFFTAHWSGNEITKVGVYNADGLGTNVAYKPASPKDGAEAVLATVDDITDPGAIIDALAKASVEQAPKVITPTGETMFPEPVEILPSGVFPEPPHVRKTVKATANIPQVTGTGADLTARPPVKGANVFSVHDAAMSVIAGAKSTDPGSSTKYALMDEDYIEDTLVRFEAAVDSDGNQYVEMRFRLQEDVSERVSDQLLTSSTVEYGGWTQTDTVRVTDLVEGDYISVRLSKGTNALKPLDEADRANAQVTGPAELIGKSDKSGYDVYRLPIKLTNGSTATVDVELRDAATIAKIDWDPDLVIQHSSSKYGLSQAAQDAGWLVKPGQEGRIYSAFGGKADLNVTETGEAIIRTDYEANPHGGHSISGGQTLYRTMPDGTIIRFNAVASSSGGTKQGDVRRSEIARDVHIRVQVTPDGLVNSFNSPNSPLDAAISSALEAVGIPVDKQVPPSQEALARFGLNKAYKHFAPTFKHRETLKVNAVREDDPQVKTLVDQMNTALGLTGKDRVTLADIEFAVAPDGRIFPKLSTRAAQAVTKRQGNTYYRHSLSGNSIDTATQLIASPVITGLLGADERWSLGVTTNGWSTGTDVKNGAGDRCYLTGTSKPHIAGEVIYSATSVNSTLDGYVNDGDGFGRRSSKNDFVQHRAAPHHNEFMIKRKLDIGQIAYIQLGTSADHVIKKLKSKGITTIGSRPIEQVIVDSVPSGLTGTSPEFQDLGTDAFEVGTTLEELVAAVESGAGAAAGGATGGPAV